MKKHYETPELVQVSLVPEEAVLSVCKNHEDDYNIARDLPYCSWPAHSGGGNCRGVTGS